MTVFNKYGTFENWRQAILSEFSDMPKPIAKTHFETVVISLLFLIARMIFEIGLIVSAQQSHPADAASAPRGEGSDDNRGAADAGR